MTTLNYLRVNRFCIKLIEPLLMCSSYQTTNKYPILDPIITTDSMKLIYIYLRGVNHHDVKLCRRLGYLEIQNFNLQKKVCLDAVLFFCF